MASSDDLARLNRHLAALRVETQSIPLERILHEQPVACVDGRNPDGVVGAPGGNAGLFLLLLAAYERFGGAALRDDEIRQLFDAYLDHFGRFYLHSDTGALGRLFDAAAHAAPELDLPTTLEDRTAMIRRPAAPVRSAMKPLLARPEHLGCGHLRLIAENPSRYHIRPRLLEVFLSAYFDALWSGDDRVVFDVLEGSLDARAVLNVHTDDAPDTAVPLPCPHFDAVQLFVHHPSAVAFLRARHADFLTAQGRIDADDAEAFGAAHAELGAAQLEATLAALAPELPQLNVHATSSGDLRLSGTGAAW